MDMMRKNALEIVAKLQKAGYETYWAGGCVRDIYLEKAPKDFDIATAATPNKIKELFSHSIFTGVAFGVVRVVVNDLPFEVATFREDGTYTNGRHPDAIVFSHPEKDAQRRDFTINALFYDPIEEKLIDFVGGLHDLQNGIIRCVGDPVVRLSEDYLRMLRAVRFSATYTFKIHERTEQAIKSLASAITAISSERIQQEINQLLLIKSTAGQCLLILHNLGLLQAILPEVAAMAGQEQPPAFHPEGDVLTHTAIMLDKMKHPSLILAYAVLLHDVGKPPTATWTTEPDGSKRIRFNAHAKVGAELAKQILTRFRLSNRLINEVVLCVKNHMKFIDIKHMKTSKLRPWLASPSFPTELELHRLDCISSHGNLTNYTFAKTMLKKYESIPLLPKSWATGIEIMKLGIEEGPMVGYWLKIAYEAQLEGNYLNTEELLKWLKVQIEIK